MNNLIAKSLVAVVVTGTLMSQAKAAVWVDTNTWNSSWEQQYSDWVHNEFNEDFFTAGKYKGTATDCADAVYLSRLIFAYENKLPFVIKDPTGGNSKITNKMSRFDGNSEMSRVRQFMNYIMDLVGTKTLPFDSYPVAVTRDFIRPGTIWSRPRITKDNIFRRIFGGTVKEDPGHAEVVKTVEDTGVIYTIGSTVPQAVRQLNMTSSLVFMPVETSTGLRDWMEPNFYAQPVESLPGYSLEQYKMARSLSDWTKQVQSRLALRAEQKPEALKRMAKDLCTLVNSRKDVVRKSEARRAALNGTCMDRDDYDAYSTPSRDKRIRTILSDMITMGSGFGFSASSRGKQLQPYMTADVCPDFEWSPGQKMSLFDYTQRVLKGDVSSNPNDSLAARWGVEDAARNNCPKYE